MSAIWCLMVSCPNSVPWPSWSPCPTPTATHPIEAEISLVGVCSSGLNPDDVLLRPPSRWSAGRAPLQVVPCSSCTPGGPLLELHSRWSTAQTSLQVVHCSDPHPCYLLLRSPSRSCAAHRPRTRSASRRPVPYRGDSIVVPYRGDVIVVQKSSSAGGACAPSQVRRPAWGVRANARSRIGVPPVTRNSAPSTRRPARRLRGTAPFPDRLSVSRETDQPRAPSSPSSARMRLRSVIVAKSMVMLPLLAPMLTLTRVSKRSPRCSAMLLR